MKKLILIPAFALSLSGILSGCSGFDIPQLTPMPSSPDAPPPSETVSAPPPPPPQNAVTVDQFDTASVEDKKEALAPEPTAKTGIGTTIATLGDVAQPGFWLETPLVSSVKEGRVTSNSTGRTVKVELRPISGPEGAGSRISLSALRLLDLPLAGLHEVEVADL